MSFVRPIFIAILLVAWWPAVNGCALASALPQIFSDCCDNSPSDADGCSENSCQKCVNLETGLAMSLLHAVKLQPPPLRVDAWLINLQRLLSDQADVDMLLPACWHAPPERSLWQFIVRTALPVRGPSLA